MQENIYERIHRSLSWKKILAFNVVLFLITIVPITLRLAKQDTESRTGAALSLENIEVTPPPAYPSQPPTLERVSEFYGKKGDTVVVIGANFGAYKWGSKIYVGNVEAQDDNIVRWSNNIIEVQIPEQARTGKVWVSVNGQQAVWDGTLLLYDGKTGGQIGISKQNGTTAVVSTTSAPGVITGFIEIGHTSEPLEVSVPNGQVSAQSTTVDSLGKRTKIEFRLDTPLGSSNTNLLLLSYPGLGGLELVRVELLDTGNRLVNVFSDPLLVKTN